MKSGPFTRTVGGTFLVLKKKIESSSGNSQGGKYVFVQTCLRQMLIQFKRKKEGSYFFTTIKYANTWQKRYQLVLL